MLHWPYRDMPRYLSRYDTEFPDFYVHLNLAVELGVVCYYHVVKHGWSATMVQT